MRRNDVRRPFELRGFSADRAVGISCSGWRAYHENHNADQQHPGGKQQLKPSVLPGCQQQSQRDQIAEEGDPRGSPAVRIPSVLTEMVNTAAIRMAYTEISVWVVLRPYAKSSALGSDPVSSASRLVE